VDTLKDPTPLKFFVPKGRSLGSFSESLLMESRELAQKEEKKEKEKQSPTNKEEEVKHRSMNVSSNDKGESPIPMRRRSLSFTNKMKSLLQKDEHDTQSKLLHVIKKEDWKKNEKEIERKKIYNANKRHKRKRKNYFTSCSNA